MTTMRISFQLKTVKIDCRDFRQDSDLFEPTKPVVVAVNIEDSKENLVNFEGYQAAILGGSMIDPVLTPAGWAAVKSALETPFMAQPATPKTDDWDEVKATEVKLNGDASKSTEWDEEEFTTTKPKPVVETETLTPEKEDWGDAPPFEEKDEEVAPGTEPWDEKKEDWDGEK